MINFFKPLLSSVSSFFGGWWIYLLAGALVFGLGCYSGYQIDNWRMTGQVDTAHQETLVLQGQFQEYKNLALQEAVRTSEETVSKIELAQNSIQQLTQRLQQSQNKQRQLSSALTESLKNVPSNLQNNLSDPVRVYLDRLRNYQRGAGQPTTNN